jgi:REP element-mobilizing transposase RayT
VRSIERRKIFLDDPYRFGFLEQLGSIVEHTGTICYAWALIPNHAHFLLQTGNASIASVMRRLLTGHAVSCNRRHRRYGHLFQNRYKSIFGKTIGPVRRSYRAFVIQGVEQVWQAGKARLQVKARSLLGFCGVRELGESMTAMARRLCLSVAAVSKAVIRGAEIADQNGFRISIS